MWRSCALLVALSLVAGWSAWACGFFEEPEPTPAPLPTAAVTVVEYGAAEAGVQPAQLTRTADDLRRIREQHAALIASTGTDPLEPTATPEPEARQRAAVAAVAGGLPDDEAVSERHSGWFDPERGLEFYRDAGGDWTAASMRERHPYAPLVYYDGYEEVSNFSDRSLPREVARDLAYEAYRVLPIIGSPTPQMADLLFQNLGWEFRDRDTPVMNVWSSFRVSEPGGGGGRFAVGGVMRFTVGSLGEGDDRQEYLQLGRWIDSVVVERLE